MNTQEVSVPTTVDDFEAGDRVWYVHPKKNIKMLATVMSNPEKRFIIVGDEDGLMMAVLPGPIPQNSTFRVSLSGLNKVMDVTSLTPGMKVSKKLPTTGGLVFRFPAIIDSVEPGKRIVLSYHYQTGNDCIEEFLEGTDGKTLEYQLAGWEVEE